MLVPPTTSVADLYAGGVFAANIGSVLAEPRAPDPPTRVWWDWVLVGCLLVTAIGEAIFRSDVPARPLATVVALLVIPALLWRRTHPLLATAIGFGGGMVLYIPMILDDVADVGLNVMACVLLLPYALYRWASGREALAGTAIIAVPAGLALATTETPVGEVIGGVAALIAAFALGAAMRYRAVARRREVQQIRALERGELARELHDTVAHHVSAIAIQAQAGRAVAATDPASAVEALAVIETEASRTLYEMRTMVGVLRDGEATGAEPVEYGPQRGISDLDELTRMSPLVQVHRGGDLAGLPQPVEAGGLPDLSGVGHQRDPAFAERHGGHRGGHRRRRRRTVACARRRRSRPPRGRSGLRPARHGRARQAARRRLPGRAGLCRRLDRRGDSPEGDAAMTIQGTSQGTIRVVVADDQLLVRTGLTMILNAQPGIEVVGEATDGHEAVAVARELRPDVCLFDIRMPGIDGVEATRQLAGPGVENPMAVVVITTFDLDEYIHGALKAGARGFLLKDAGPELLVQAIHAAANGDALISPDITRRLLTTLAGLQRSSPPPQPIEPLTEREEEVLLTVARGRTNAEIAHELHITLSTVKTHVAALMNKLGARNRVEIAMWAYETKRVKG